MKGQLIDHFSLLCFLFFLYYCDFIVYSTNPQKPVFSTLILPHLNQKLESGLILNSLFFFIPDPTFQQVLSSLSFKYITNPSTFLHIYYYHTISSTIIYLLNYCNSLQIDFPTSTLSHQQFPLHKEAISYNTNKTAMTKR